MLSELSPVEICGQLVVGAFDGPTLPAEVAEALAEGRRGGVILFKRNLPSVEAAHELTSSVLDAARDELPPFIAVDEEGGRVSRLPAPVLRLPPMRVLGRGHDPTLVRSVAEVLGRQLAGLGFNLDFAPVLDVDSNPDNPVIGDRAFSSDADHVARLGRAFIEGLQEVGVMACAKHFPGHGDTSVDSHLELPAVAHAKSRLDSVELPPFRTASLRGVAAMMTAHLVVEELDPGVPATLSRKLCTTLLRTEVGFQGVLFSDDLLMRALADHWELEETAVGAVRAGCDAVLVCGAFEQQERVHQALVAKAESDPAFLARCSEACARGLKARTKWPARPLPSAADLNQLFENDDVRRLQDAIAAASKA
jgi:beta-N-acetylhexosaminidase